MIPALVFMCVCFAAPAFAEADAGQQVAPARTVADEVDDGDDGEDGEDGTRADKANPDRVDALMPVGAESAPPPPIDAELQQPFGTADIVKSLLRTVLMLAVVLGLVWLTLSKGMGKLVERANAGKRVKIIERVALDARRSLFLVEVDGKQMLLGGGDVVRIHDFVSPGSRGFAEVLTAQSTPSGQPPSAQRPPPTTHSTAENA